MVKSEDWEKWVLSKNGAKVDILATEKKRGKNQNGEYLRRNAHLCSVFLTKISFKLMKKEILGSALAFLMLLASNACGQVQEPALDQNPGFARSGFGKTPSRCRAKSAIAR